MANIPQWSESIKNPIVLNASVVVVVVFVVIVLNVRLLHDGQTVGIHSFIFLSTMTKGNRAKLTSTELWHNDLTNYTRMSSCLLCRAFDLGQYLKLFEQFHSMDFCALNKWFLPESCFDPDRMKMRMLNVS